MKNRNLVKRFIVVAVVLCAAIMIVTRLMYTATRQMPPLQARVQAGIGTQVPLPQTLSQVQNSVTSAASFVLNRAEIVITQDVSNRLVQMEQRTLEGQAQRLTVETASLLLNDTLMERISSLTDNEIKQMADSSFKTVPDFNHPSRPDVVMLRADGRSVNGKQFFFELAKNFRDSSGMEAQLYRSRAPSEIRNEVDKHLYALKGSLSSTWGANASMTPLQVFLIAYAVVTDDSLIDSQADLQAQMTRIEDHLFSQYGTARSSAGRPPYGVNGYIYASPVNLLFNSSVINRFLDRIEGVN
jgi:hypothetical protein